mmetsp:Transcript_16217/g.34307  ORF Transcript_16217/g.34307 Transcript_16217/m.34307 type:complete len:81 (-) Transcript_16217:222-464(-)
MTPNTAQNFLLGVRQSSRISIESESALCLQFDHLYAYNERRTQSLGVSEKEAWKRAGPPVQSHPPERRSRRVGACSSMTP